MGWHVGAHSRDMPTPTGPQPHIQPVHELQGAFSRGLKRAMGRKGNVWGNPTGRVVPALADGWRGAGGEHTEPTGTEPDSGLHVGWGVPRPVMGHPGSCEVATALLMAL